MLNDTAQGFSAACLAGNTNYRLRSLPVWRLKPDTLFASEQPSPTHRPLALLFPSPYPTLRLEDKLLLVNDRGSELPFGSLLITSVRHR